MSGLVIVVRGDADSGSSINMPLADVSMIELQQAAAAQQKDGSKAKPLVVKDDDLSYMPVYDLDPQYGQQIDAWATTAANQAPGQRVTLNMREGASFSKEELGFEHTTSSGFDLGWLSWGSEGEEQTKTRTYRDSSFAGDITLTMRWDQSSLFDIGPGGKW